MSARQLYLAALLLLFSASGSLAQVPTAAATGTVRDTAGDPLSQANVVARHLATGLQYAALSDVHGRYWLRSIPPGQYDLTAGRIGVGSVVRQGVRLAVGQDVTVDFVLEMRPVELPPLEVVDREPPIQTTQADISFVVNREQIIELPDESRSFMELAQLAPGATRAIDSGEPVGPTSLGALSSYYVGVLVDGISLVGSENQELLGSLPLIAIEEFEVLTASYSAQYGQAASGIVNAVTRRGSNQPRVDGFMFYRHHSLNAQGVFERTKPEFKRQHWGLSAGGPITVDRTHVIVALERKVERSSSTVETGGLFPQLEGTFETPFEDNLIFARLDHRFNAAQEFTIRYAGQLRSLRTDVGNSSTCGIVGTGSIGSSRNGAVVDGTMNSLLGVHRLSSRDGRAVNEARFSFQRRTERRVPVDTGPTLAFPTICDGGNAFSWKQQSSRFEFRDDFSLALQGDDGSHRLSAGILASLVDVDTRTGNFTNGAFSFLEDTASLPVQFQLALEGVGTVKSSVQLALYIQDQWSPSSRLTFDFGLRYDIETNSTNQGFVAPEAGILPFVSTNERPVDADNIAPRLSFAWDPAGDARTVVRGGFGLFYNQGALAFAGLEASRNRIAVVPEPGTTDRDAIPIDPDATLVFPTFLGSDTQTPSTRQLSLGIARVMPGQIVISLDGILVQGYNLPTYRQLNTITDFVDGLPVFRYPGFLLFQLVNQGQAEAQMLLIRARRQAEVGWFDVNYTLANRKTTSDTWFDFAPQSDPNSQDFSGELGSSALDERHRLVVLGGARAPWGMGVTVKSIYSSGRPYNILTGTDDNIDFFLNDRPAGVPRNSRRGPDFFTLDLALYQRFPIGGSELEVRLNIYNLTNRDNFLSESVVGNRQSAVFGQPLGAAQKRQAEIGLLARF